MKIRTVDISHPNHLQKEKVQVTEAEESRKNPHSHLYCVYVMEHNIIY